MERFVYAAALVALPVLALASGLVDGGWKGQIGSGETATDIMMTLHTDETSLRGSIYGIAGETMVQDGTVDGSTPRLKTIQRDYAAGTQLAINCIGSLIEDLIAFSCVTEKETPQTKEFTVTRQAVLNP